MVVNDPFEVLLEHTLREVLAPPQARDDLVQRVHTRIDGVVRRRRRRHAWLLAAAAATTVVVLAVTAQPAGQPFAADRALAVARGAAFVPERSVPPGALAWNQSAPVVALRGADGVTLVVPAGAVLVPQVAHATTELLAGSVLVATRVPWRVRTPVAEIELTAGSRALLRTTPVPIVPGSTTTMTPGSTRALLAPHCALSLIVLSGLADVADGQQPVRVGPGRELRIQDRETAREHAARASMLFLLAEHGLPNADPAAAEAAAKQRDEAAQELRLLVLGSPVARSAIRRDLLAALARDHEPSEPWTVRFDLACGYDDDAVAKAFANAAERMPTVLTFDQQVALAERGVAVGTAAMRTFLSSPRGPAAAQAAAALLLSGPLERRDELRSLDELQTWVRVPLADAMLDPEQWAARCIAVMALAAKGDTEVRATFVRELRATLEPQLAAGTPEALERAAAVVRTAACLLLAERTRLSHLAARRSVFPLPELDAGTTADGVRAVLALLAP